MNRPLASFAAAAALLIFACSKDDGTGPEPPPDPPSISGISATTVSPGDTIVISGSDFVSPASANQVTFTNPLGVSAPFAGSATTLSVVVDQDATTGPVTVSHTGGSDTGPAVTVTRGVGDFFVFGGLGSGNVLSLPNPTATTRYLIIPHATNPNVGFTTQLAYQIDSGVSSARRADDSRDARPARELLGPRERFEAWRWEQTRELIERVGVPRLPETSAAAPDAASQQFRQFNVLKTTTGSVVNPASYQQVMAQLRYNGAKCLVYADVDTLATGNLSGADLRIIGEAFDNGTEATNVSFFGPYSDIDNNEKVIILITPVVNRLTPPGSGGFIAGFFLSVDLLSPPSVPSGTTNRAEIFYLLASDPGGFWGNGFPVAFTRDENITTTAHEHEHMISFSHRIFNQGGSTQITWLEEGMAHMAEDLNGFHDANQNRTDIYMQNPSNGSLENNAADLHQRGGIYLFLRLLTDRYGTGILKQIVQSRCSGRTCIQDVTGVGFYDLFAEFLAALYLEGRGITSDPRFDFTSIDLSQYGTLSVSAGVAGSLEAGNLFRTSGRHYVFTGVISTDSDFTFVDDLGNARLRNVIVRVQ